jgi:HEAT repeat protein
VAALERSREEADISVLLVAQQDPSPLVRRAAAEAFVARGGPRAIEALGAMLLDPEPAVVAMAARGLGAVPPGDGKERAGLQKVSRQYLVQAYGRTGPEGRAEIASALQALGTSLREAVEAESRQLWERNLRTLASGHPSGKPGAAEELGRSGRSEAVKRLLPLLDVEATHDAALAAGAARGLGAAGDHAALEPLEGLLLLEDARLSESAAEALGALGDPAAAEILAKAGADGPARLASVAVGALAGLPQAPDVGVALCEIAVRAVDPAVAERAARQARAREADCPERPLANRIARRGPDAAAALAALGELALPPQRLALPAERALALFNGSSDGGLRALAARALGDVGWAPAGPALARRGQALHDGLAEMRQKWLATPLPATAAPGFEAGIPQPEALASRTLAAGGSGAGPGAIPPEWAEDVDPSDAAELAAVVVAASRLKADGAAALAAATAGDPDEVVRAGGVEAIGLSGGEAARLRLAEALQDPSLRVRRAAAAILPRWGAAAVPPLAEALKRADPSEREWREELVQALGETSASEAVSALGELLSGREAPVAAVALARLGARDGARPLLEALRRPHALGRVEEIDALGQVGTAEAGPALAAELTSDRPEVRAAAVRAVGKMRYEAASPRLEALRSDYYGDVRRASVEALARLPARAPGSR